MSREYFSGAVMPTAIASGREGTSWFLPFAGTSVSIPSKGVMVFSGKERKAVVTLAEFADADLAEVVDLVGQYGEEFRNVLERLATDAASVTLVGGREMHDVMVQMLRYVSDYLAEGRSGQEECAATKAYLDAAGWGATKKGVMRQGLDVLSKFVRRAVMWNGSLMRVYAGAGDRTWLVNLFTSLAATTRSGSALLVNKYTIAPVLGTATYVHAATTLTAVTQTVSTAITNPDVPRVVTVKGNVSGIAGNVVVTGTDIDDDVITNTIALSGTAEVSGTKAFKTVTSYTLPARVHVPVLQVETATAVGTITGSGNAALTVTAAGMTGSPKEINVDVLENDTAADWAAKVRTALSEDAAVAALFDVSGATTAIVLTRKTAAANDATLNIAIDNGDCTGITPAPTSANTAQGVPADTVSVGVDDVFGMPGVITNAGYLLVKLFDGSTDAGSLAVSATRSQNLYTIAGTPNGVKTLDLVYLK